MQAVAYEKRGGIATLTVQRPPANALSPEIRHALLRALDKAEGDAEVRAIVLRGAGDHFSGGLELAEYGTSGQAPDLASLFSALESCPKPVVAALAGNVLGAGLGMALAAHYRVATSTAQLGFPEAMLGLVPEGGSTLRLARLVGAEAAMDLLLGGRPISATHADARSIVDRLVDGDPGLAAQQFARELIEDGQGPRPTGQRTDGFADPVGYQAAIAERGAALAGSHDSVQKALLSCLEAAQLLPFATGCDFEATIARSQNRSDEARALCHVYEAERRVGNIPAAARGRARALGTVAIVGGGPLSYMLAIVALDGGLRCTLHGRDATAAEELANEVRGIYGVAARRGRMTEAARDDRLSRLGVNTSLAEAAHADLVIDTTGADAASRGVLLGHLGRDAGPQTILATTGPAAEIDAIARDSGLPDRVLALRLLTPAHVLRVVEVVPGTACAPDTLATVLAALRRLGRLPVWSAPRDRQVSGEVALSLHSMALSLADWGVHPYAVDAALRDWGMATGPFQAMDAEGIARVVGRLVAQGFRTGRVLGAMLDAGRDGRTSGAGFLMYPGDATVAEPDPGLSPLLAAVRPPRDMSDEDIVGLCIGAMANTGARLVRESQVLRPSDIDVAMIVGHGFPRYRGGPMMAADINGLFDLELRLREHAKATEQGPAVDPLIRELVKNGLGFASLNRLHD